MSTEEAIQDYRRLSFLAHLVQWGCLPLSEVKMQAYVQCRDFYLEAERRAFGERFQRIPVEWKGRALWANLHLPKKALPSDKMPLIVLVHGMDDVKEEHLASELLFVEAGFAVLCMDGPGQGESFLVDGTIWPRDFDDAIVASVDALHAFPQIDTSCYAIVGISWGGLFAYKVAAKDDRVVSIFDLGGPIDTLQFGKLPFFLKSKFCQILGLEVPEDVEKVADVFALRDEGVLARVRSRVHIVHGDRDPIVSTAEKTWLRDTLLRLGRAEDVKLTVYRDGDHCCTQHVVEVRKFVAVEFMEAYRARVKTDSNHGPKSHAAAVEPAEPVAPVL